MIFVVIFYLSKNPPSATIVILMYGFLFIFYNFIDLRARGGDLTMHLHISFGLRMRCEIPVSIFKCFNEYAFVFSWYTYTF